jgi:hypothetical protein
MRSDGRWPLTAEASVWRQVPVPGTEHQAVHSAKAVPEKRHPRTIVNFNEKDGLKRAAGKL